MRKCLTGALAMGLLLAGSSWASAQDDAKSILEKAVKAHGGAEKLSQIKAQQAKSKGRLELLGGLDFTQESTFQYPTKFKEAMHLSVMGNMVDVVTVFNGKDGWISAMGQTMPLEGDQMEAVKEAMDMLTLARLAFLGGKDYELAGLGESKINDRPCVGVKISRMGKKDVNLYFDKETNLLTKLEHRVKDPMAGMEVNEERFISEYQEMDGMKVAKKASIHRDGKKFMDIEILEVKFLDKVEDGAFEKP
jgi:hypothetical protein